MARLLICRGTPPRVVVDQVLGRRVEELFRAAGLLELEVDVGGGLLLGERSQMEAHGDAVQQGGVQRLPQGLPQRFLAGQHDFQRRGVVQGGTDQAGGCRSGPRRRSDGPRRGSPSRLPSAWRALSRICSKRRSLPRRGSSPSLPTSSFNSPAAGRWVRCR